MIRNLFCVVLVAAACGAGASPSEQVLTSFDQLGIKTTSEQRAQIASDVLAASEATEDPEWFGLSAARLPEMAALSQSASRHTTRILLEDMHRQLIALMLSPGNRASALLESRNPTLHLVEAGVGLTLRDLSSVVLLEALREDLPDHPRDIKISKPRAAKLKDEITEELKSSSDAQWQFLARVDAWTYGTLAAWETLSPEERLAAVSLLASDATPAEPVLTKVTGTTDLLLWMGGMEIGLTDAEKQAYPDLNAYLERGYMAGGTDKLLAERVRSKGLEVLRPRKSASSADLATVMMMMELNYNLLFNQTLSNGGLMGLE